MSRRKLDHYERTRVLMTVLLILAASGLIALGMAEPPKSAQVTR